MKGLTKAMVIAGVAISFLTFFPQKNESTGRRLVCSVIFRMENKDRYCAGNVNEECPPSWHTVPFGNWGVDSNVGSRIDDHQFQGWYPEDGWLQWNSCTGDYPYPDPTCKERYNTKWENGGCTEQETSYVLDKWGIWEEKNIYGGGYRDVRIPEPHWNDG